MTDSPSDPSRGRRLTARWRDALLVFTLALLVRGAVVLWAKGRFPPADDGSFYDVVAARIAHGAGYTWLWPDGAVTYAAHYPVGYPALLGVVYALFGATPTAAMGFNALLGALSALAAHTVMFWSGGRVRGLVAGLLIALHPGLVFYTPALMTEGVAAELLVIALFLTCAAARGRRAAGFLGLLGVCMGVLVLVRPQLLLMAPLFGFFSLGATQTRWGARAVRAGVVSALAVAVCLPWTARNCARMDRCVFVSANGGWNLLIGSAPEANGGWIAIEGERVPPECRTVFGEAEKDRCFGQAGMANIRQRPWAFLALVPRKLSQTFDYFGAPGHYLHTSNYLAFDEARKVRLGVVETLWERLVLLAAIAQVAGRGQGQRRVRLLGGAISAVFALTRWGYLAYLGFVVTSLLAGRELLKRPVAAVSAGAILTTALTHAVFFGAGRYGFVCAALLCLASVGEPEPRPSSSF